MMGSMSQGARARERSQDVLDAAMRLPVEDRARLATDLLTSLGAPDDGRSEEEWLTELERRAEAADAGAPGIPWAEARQRIEDTLDPK